MTKLHGSSQPPRSSDSGSGAARAHHSPASLSTPVRALLLSATTFMLIGAWRTAAGAAVQLSPGLGAPPPSTGPVAQPPRVPTIAWQWCESGGATLHRPCRPAGPASVVQAVAAWPAAAPAAAKLAYFVRNMPWLLLYAHVYNWWVMARGPGAARLCLRLPTQGGMYMYLHHSPPPPPDLPGRQGGV
jgi:hypothetical protein